jgi:hypothetical protein
MEAPSLSGIADLRQRRGNADSSQKRMPTLRPGLSCPVPEGGSASEAFALQGLQRTRGTPDLHLGVSPLVRLEAISLDADRGSLGTRANTYTPLDSGCLAPARPDGSPARQTAADQPTDRRAS